MLECIYIVFKSGRTARITLRLNARTHSLARSPVLVYKVAETAPAIARAGTHARAHAQIHIHACVRAYVNRAKCANRPTQFRIRIVLGRSACAPLCCVRANGKQVAGARTVSVCVCVRKRARKIITQFMHIIRGQREREGEWGTPQN